MSYDLMRELDEAAEELGWSRSQIIVRASKYYLDEIKRRRERRAAAAPFPPPPAP
jgi:metal-responsive CopG/Arc/MetJ family transcriptional regulator